MSAVLAAAVGLLTAFGVYLLLARRVLPVILGFSLLTHAANLVVLAAGDWGLRAPILVAGAPGGGLADPLPQAMVLTAIVISMVVTLYLLAAYAASARLLGDDSLDRPASSDAGRPEERVRRELGGASRVTK